MRVKMLTQISGTRNGQPWPNIGETTDLPDDEARDLIITGQAVDENSGVDTDVIVGVQRTGIGSGNPLAHPNPPFSEDNLAPTNPEEVVAIMADVDAQRAEHQADVTKAAAKVSKERAEERAKDRTTDDKAPTGPDRTAARVPDVKKR